MDLPAMNCDWSVLSELFLGLVHLANEINEGLAQLRHALLWPIGEVELTNRPRLTILHKQLTHLRKCLTNQRQL